MSPSAVDYTGSNHRSVDHSASLDEGKKRRVRDSILSQDDETIYLPGQV